MLVPLAILTSMLLLFSSLISEVVPFWAVKLQSLCTSRVPGGPYAKIYEGLICGARLPPSDFKSHLLNTGLFHLIVASGAHLAFVESLLRLALRKRFEFVIPCMLFSYALVTGLCPPFVRALLYWAFRILSQKFQLAWTPLQSLTLAGFAALVVCNRPSELLSLAFSWIAGVAVQIFSEKKKEPTFSDALLFQVSIYALMIPPTLALATPHPLSIVWNLVLGPLLTFLLFPAALLVLILPNKLSWVADTGVSISAWLVKQASYVTPESLTKTPFSPVWIWLYLFSLVIAAHFFEHLQRRRAVP